MMIRNKRVIESVSILTNHCSHFKPSSSRRIFTSSGVLPLNNVQEHNHQNVTTPFPWRERQDHAHYNKIQFERMEKELPKYQNVHDFLRGSLAAFHCAVNAIFQHTKLSKQRIEPADDIKKEIRRVDKTIRDDTLPFYDIFETFLSRFLDQAIDRFVSQYAGYQYCYELLKVKLVKIHCAEYIMYSSELAKRHPYLITNPTFGDKFRELKFIVPSNTLPEDGICYDNSEVLRVWVDIDCEGKN